MATSYRKCCINWVLLLILLLSFGDAFPNYPKAPESFTEAKPYTFPELPPAFPLWNPSQYTPISAVGFAGVAFLVSSFEIHVFNSSD